MLVGKLGGGGGGGAVKSSCFKIGNRASGLPGMN